MKVGFVGTGIMGAPMALNILKRGHQLTVYNRTREKTLPLVEAGATVVASLEEIRDVEVLITVVADGSAERVVLFESGLIDLLRSTVSTCQALPWASTPRGSWQRRTEDTDVSTSRRRCSDVPLTWRRKASFS